MGPRVALRRRVSFPTACVAHEDFCARITVAGPVSFPPTFLAPVSSAKDLTSFIIKVLPAKIDIAIGTSAHVLPSITAHIFFGHEILFEVRNVLTNLDNTQRWVKFGPRAPVSVKVGTDTGIRIVRFTHIVFSVLKAEYIDVRRHFWCPNSYTGFKWRQDTNFLHGALGSYLDGIFRSPSGISSAC
jgi:hypothetical protein